MKSSNNNKGLLLPWLTRALDEEWYVGLRWIDREHRIFYVNWTHKSAEQWSQSEIEVCEGWANHKGKKTGKNDKQLKATFRCALNSKKELKEVQRTKRRRYWRFIDPSEYEDNKNSKKKPKKEKLFGTNIDSPGTSTDDNTFDPAIGDFATSITINIKQEANFENMSLPSYFETFCQFFPLTTPPESDDSLFFDTDFSESCSPPSEDSRLTPPVQDVLPTTTYQYPTIHNRLQPVNTDVWQPNFMSIPQALQDLTGFAQFSNGVDELIRPIVCQDLAKENFPSRLQDMDQFVPAMDTFQNSSVSITQYSCAEKPASSGNVCDSTTLDDDYLLNLDGAAVDPVEFDNLVKELSRSTPT